MFLPRVLAKDLRFLVKIPPVPPFRKVGKFDPRVGTSFTVLAMKFPDGN
jgi:hypothetical protein